MKDTFFPHNLDNPDSVVLDGQFFYYAHDGVEYLRNLGYSLQEARDYLQLLVAESHPKEAALLDRTRVQLINGRQI